MSTIVTRAGKGSPLTNTEVDSNFTNLNTDKLESDGSVLADKIAFDTAAALTPTTGQMVWDAETGTVDIGLNGATAPVMSVGEDQFYRVINQTGSTITKGTLVMAFGTVGASGVIKVKAWDGSQASKTIMGLVMADIPTENDPTESGLGYILAFGKLKGIQTNGANYGETWVNGDIIYAGASSGLTKTLPVAPNTKTTIAIVINAHATNGTLFVRPSYGSSLAEDELVQLASLANGDVLSYDSTDGRFENKTLAAAGIYATSNPAGYTTNTGTVTSVGGTGTVNGITLTGTVTSSGNLTLGGTLSGVNLTSQVTGTLPVGNGGTGATTLTGVVKGNGTSAFTAGMVALGSEVSGTLPVANGGTGATTLTANNVLLGNGTSAVQVVAPGTSGNVLTSNGTTWVSGAAPASAGVVQAVATGSLANGDKVVVNTDGTVSVVAETTSDTLGTRAFAPTNVFNEKTYAAGYDSTNDKVIVFYRDTLNRFVAAAGQVTGTTFTFGSPIVIDADKTIGNRREFAFVHDPTSGKNIIFYTDANSYPSYRVLTVSGTTLSAGTKVVLYSYGRTSVSALVDSVSGHIITLDGSQFFIANSFTVSGTTLSAVIHTNETNLSPGVNTSITICQDVVSGKFVVAANKIAYILSYSASTGFSYGANVTFYAGTSTDGLRSQYISHDNSVMLSYHNAGVGSSFVTLVSLNSAGSTITLGNSLTVQTSVFGNEENDIAYSQSTQVILALRQTGVEKIIVSSGALSKVSVESLGINYYFNSVFTIPPAGYFFAYYTSDSFLYGRVLALGVVTRNLTSENFIGISNAAYANGATATIQTVGSVDDAQSGLTAGQAYYVQNDGTLSTTPDTPSVFAGTAVSATKLLIGKTIEEVVNLASGVTGVLSLANGGTGVSSVGASGNVLTSNGATWVSAGLPAGGLTYVVKTANYTTQDKEGVLADTSGGAFTVTLPATPSTGAQVVVADVGSNWESNNLTVGRNGSTIDGLAENLVCDLNGVSLQLVYTGSTWKVYTSF